MLWYALRRTLAAATAALLAVACAATAVRTQPPPATAGAGRQPPRAGDPGAGAPHGFTRDGGVSPAGAGRNPTPALRPGLPGERRFVLGAGDVYARAVADTVARQGGDRRGRERDGGHRDAPAAGPGATARDMSQDEARRSVRPPAQDEARRPAAGRRLAGKAAVPALALSAVSRAAQTRTTADTLAAHAAHIGARVAAYHRWGLKKPLPARPAPPVIKPRVRAAKVVRRVPTEDKVIFLTIDDGAEKDPEFLRLVEELDLPVTSFLTHEEALRGAGYDYFRELARRGGTLHNHTLHHRFLPALSYRRQRAEICGQQDHLKAEFGGPEPRLFRPPYGAYDKDTLRAVRDCGLDAVVMWGLEAWAKRIDFQKPGRRLRPGAIILTHYRGPGQWGGSMTDMTRRVLRLAAEQGYAVARLEDYL